MEEVLVSIVEGVAEVGVPLSLPVNILTITIINIMASTISIAV